MNKRSFAVVLSFCAALIASPAHAKVFVGVLWPMFGPLPAIGLVELVAELKMMPDVEVTTYVHQAWPSLVDDLGNLPPGTRTIVIGYSLGANSTANVADAAKHIDEIIALQPSMLSWNPDVEGGKVGRYIEIYNPNRWETFGGMGSKKLVGPNIEYIANNDSHVGAQFSSQFRNLVKTEVARLTTEDRVEIARADTAPRSGPATPDDSKLAEAERSDQRIAQAEAVKPAIAKPEAARPEIAESGLAKPVAAKPAAEKSWPRPVHLADATADRRPDYAQAFLDRLSSAVNSGDLSPDVSANLSAHLEAEPRLTAAALLAYAKRTSRAAAAAGTLASNAF